MANVRAKIIVEGEIQGVGYREVVKRKAFEGRILGRVRNLKDGTVEIIVEGEEKNIEDLINQIRIQKYPIFVTGISTAFEGFRGEFKTFTVIRDSDLQKEMFEAISGGTVEIKFLSEKTDKTLEKQDKTLEKLDGMTQELHEFRTETQNNFADLGDKYHTVSKELLSINENIAKLHAALTKSTKTIEKSNDNIAKLVEYIGLLVARYVGKSKKKAKR